MYRYELYNVDDIDQLKKELDAYKQTVKTMTEGNLFEDYFKTKDDFYDLKMKIFELEGDMKAMENNYREEISNHQMEEQHLANQLTSITGFLQQLRQDAQLIKQQFEQLPFVEISEKINQLISNQNTNAMEQKIELEHLKEEISQIKELLKPKEDNTAKNNRSAKRSDYKQLQGILQFPNNVEQPLNKKKNNQVNKQHYSHTKSNNEKSYYTHANSQESETISMSKAKKTYRNAQYELNKNIITRTVTPKNKSQEQKEESLDTDSTLPTTEDTTPVVNNNLTIENNITEENIPSTEIEEEPIESITESSEEKPIEPTKSNSEQSDESTKKSDFTSLLSIFKRG